MNDADRVLGTDHSEIGYSHSLGPLIPGAQETVELGWSIPSGCWSACVVTFCILTAVLFTVIVIGYVGLAVRDLG